MLGLRRTAQFKRDVKLAKRRGKDINKLIKIINLILAEEELPDSARDHELVGDYKGHRESHVEPDWLLIYRIERGEMICTAARTGTPADLFKK